MVRRETDPIAAECVRNCPSRLTSLESVTFLSFAALLIIRTTAWFLTGSNIHLYGGGTLDGNGQIWWDTYAANGDSGAAGGSSRTFARPVPLTVGNATNVLVEDLHIINSPFWHNFVYQSKNVVYKYVRVVATGELCGC